MSSRVKTYQEGTSLLFRVVSFICLIQFHAFPRFSFVFVYFPSIMSSHTSVITHIHHHIHLSSPHIMSPSFPQHTELLATNVTPTPADKAQALVHDWEQVLHQLQLSPTQQACIINLAHNTMHRLQGVRVKRQQLCIELERVVTMGALGADGMVCCCCWWWCCMCCCIHMLRSKYTH